MGAIGVHYGAENLREINGAEMGAIGVLQALAVQKRGTCGLGVATSPRRPKKGDMWARGGY